MSEVCPKNVRSFRRMSEVKQKRKQGKEGECTATNLGLASAGNSEVDIDKIRYNENKVKSLKINVI